ncbi:MAG: PaaI family thioesterase [candidate division Zixibacteria bacterium]|nr:PaaI family thioesterase [candidate division Zixibacteria bacterium]
MKAPDVDYPVPFDGYRERTEGLFYGMPFVNYLGIKIIEFGPGWLDCQIENRIEIQQQNGYVHAGVIATMADMSAGIAGATLVDETRNPLSVGFNIALLRPALGERIIARGRVVKRGKQINLAESWIYGVTGESEKLVARGYLTMTAV